MDKIKNNKEEIYDSSGGLELEKYIFYRITSKINDKPRTDEFTKLRCLENLIETFPDYKIVCIADNCDDATLNILRLKNFFKLVITNLGNAGSFKHLLCKELPLVNDSDLIYFVEDDYIHSTGANKRLLEGLTMFDYVTVYDHPDKYGTFQGSKNPFVSGDLLSEDTKIIRINGELWRTTNSTTMTFASFAKTLRRDSRVFLFFSSNTSAPKDFHAWISLTCPRIGALRILKAKWLAFLIFAKVRSLFVGSRTLGVPLKSGSAHLEAGFIPFDFQSAPGLQPERTLSNQINPIK